jgi:hypothetical protein
MSGMVNFAMKSVHLRNTETTAVFVRTAMMHVKPKGNVQVLVTTKDLEVVMIVTCSL